MNYSVVLLAAGSGSRMNLGYNKMFLQIYNHPLITLSAKVFFKDPTCTQIILVTNNNEVSGLREELKKANLLDERITFTEGGTERQYSVYNGLQLVQNRIVLVHDGARPFITQKMINELKMNAIEFGCVIPGVKVKDTIKLVSNGLVEQTLPRHQLIAVQTPQACLTDLLLKAHEKAKIEKYLGTDEASLIEKYLTTKVKVIDGNYDNIKITTQEDINYATNIFKNYFKEEVV